MVSGIRGWENGCNVTPYWLSSAYDTHSEHQTSLEEDGMRVKRAETNKLKKKENKKINQSLNDERTVFSGSLSRESL